MKTILSIILGASLLTSGCASVTAKAPTAQETIAFVHDHEAQIRAAIAVAKRLALRYAVEDPAKRKEIADQVQKVSEALGLLLSRGEFDPESVAAALKVKEQYVSDILSVVGLAYQTAFAKFEERDEAQLAIVLLKVLAEGLADKTFTVSLRASPDPRWLDDANVSYSSFVEWGDPKCLGSR